MFRSTVDLLTVLIAKAAGQSALDGRAAAGPDSDGAHEHRLRPESRALRLLARGVRHQLRQSAADPAGSS